MKRLLSICLVVCLFATLAATPAAVAAETKYGTVHGGWLRLRAAASFDAATINSYNTGTVVTILSTVGSWYQVRTPDGLTGYMYGSYLTIGSSSGGSGSSGGVGSATVWSSNGYGVRMRSGPGTGYRILAVYSVGTQVTVLERGSYWSRIQVGSRTGYMMNQFLNGGVIPPPAPSATGNATIWSGNGYGVRLRTGAGTGYSIIGVYSVGTRVTVLEKGPVWSKIQVGSRVGYMMSEFLHFYANTEVTAVTLNTMYPTVGTVMSASSITPAGAAVNYQWLVGGAEKSTAATYTVVAADAAQTIQLKVTGRDGYTGTVWSAATFAVSTTSTISGVTLNVGTTENPVVGDVLSATVTPAGATVGYQWMVGGALKATTATYTVVNDDIGKAVQLTVVGIGGYTGTAISPLTAPVLGNAAVTAVSIRIDGATLPIGSTPPAVGDRLVAVTNPANAKVYYGWIVETAAGSGTYEAKGYAKEFVVGPDCLGKKIRVEVAAIAPYYNYGNVAALSSAVTAAVVNNTERKLTGISLSATAPSVGHTVTVNVAPLSPPVADASLYCNYQWTINGVTVSTTNSYTVVEADKGQDLYVTVSGKNGYTGSYTEKATVQGTPITSAKFVLTGSTLDVKVEPATTVEGTDYDVTISPAITTPYTIDPFADSGKTFTLTVKGKNNYYGTFTDTYTVPGATLTTITDVVFSQDGTNLWFEAKAGSTTVPSAGYTWSWNDGSVNFPRSYSPGTYSVTVTGLPEKGYQGTVTKQYTVPAPAAKIPQTLTLAVNVGLANGDGNFPATATITGGTPVGAVTYSWGGNTSWGASVVLAPGETITLTVTVAGDAQYESWSDTATVTGV